MGKCNPQFTEFSTKSNESYMKIFPKASFGNPSTLTEFKIMENLKPYNACSHFFWNLKCTSMYFLLFQMWSMHDFVSALKNHITCIHALKFELFSQKQVVVSQMNLYVNFALKLLDIVEEWRIISGAYMYLKPELFQMQSMH